MPSMPVGQDTLEKMTAAGSYNDWIFQQISPWITGRVCEIGAGIGTFLDYFSIQGYSPIAFEINPHYIHLLRRRFSFRQVKKLDISISHLPAAYVNQFDTVYMLNVLEHIEADNQAVKNLYQMLHPGGRLILLVPAHPFAFNSIDISLGHYRRYTIQSLNHLLMDSGFKPVLTRYLNPIGICGWWLSRFFPGSLRIQSWHVRSFSLFSRPFLWLEKYISPPFGLSVLSVLEKPIL